MSKDCGCLKGSVGLIDTSIFGSVGLTPYNFIGSVGVLETPVLGSAGVIDSSILGSAGVIDFAFSGQVGIICMPSTELFIKVTPDTLWLTPDTLSGVEFEVISNTEWTIE